MKEEKKSYTLCTVCGHKDYGTQPARCRKCRSRKIRYGCKDI